MSGERSPWAAVVLVLVTTLWAGCPDGGPGDLVDGGPEAGPEASVQEEASVPDAGDSMVPDAHVPSVWCGDTPQPDIDPNAVPLTSDPPGLINDVWGWDGSYVVYARAAPGAPQPSVDYEIYVFDLDAWQEIQVTQQPSSWQVHPAISGDEVIWADSRYQSSGGSNFELVIYDIPADQETQLTDDATVSEVQPELSASHITYLSFIGGSSSAALQLKERAGGSVTELSPAELAPDGVSLGEHLVSWTARPEIGPSTLNKAVHIRDLATGDTTCLQSTVDAVAWQTSVSGRKVVWQDYRHGQWDLYLYDTETEQETRLTDDPFDQLAPIMAGNLVSFVDYRYSQGWWDNQQCAYDIAVLDLDTMITRRVTTLPWFWWGKVGHRDDGLLLAILRDRNSSNSESKLYIFDLIDMGILDSMGQHVLPLP